MESVCNNIPPLGAIPKYAWDEMRIEALRKAIIDFCNVKRPILQSWVDEYNELCKNR